MATLPKLCLITCGGTITMTQDPLTKTLLPSRSTRSILERVPELTSIAEIDSVFVTDIDSSNMTPELWISLAKTIAERIDKYDGFIVTHGTDTMAYTASALSFLLQGLSRPVILTGAQTPISENTGSDGRNNLVFSAMFATQDLAEVCILFGAELLRGNRARKFSQFDFDAFKSFNLPPLGKIGIRPKLSEFRTRRSTSKLIPLVPRLESVCLIKYFPGLKPEIISKALELGYKGLVIEGVGAGNLPSQIDFASQIKRATEAGVPVVITTQCIVGAAEMFIYEVGKFAEQNGAISGLDMTPEAALTKLMWVLTQTNKVSEVSRLMQKNLVGEVSE